MWGLLGGTVGGIAGVFADIKVGEMLGAARSDGVGDTTVTVPMARALSAVAEAR